MIQITLNHKGKIIPEWEDENERLVFRLSPVNITNDGSIHQEMEDAGTPVPANEALGTISLHYEDDVVQGIQIVLELPDEVWDNLANWADDLLDEEFLPDDDDEDNLFDEEDWDDEDY